MDTRSSVRRKEAKEQSNNMAPPKKTLTQSQLQLTTQRRGSLEDSIKVTDPNILLLDEIRKIRQEMIELRSELKEDIKEASQETREEIKETRSEIKETRSEIRKDLKKELDILGKRMDKISTDVSKTQKDLDTYKVKILELEKSNTDLVQKQEQQYWKDLNQELKYREKSIKIRGVSEKPGGNLFERIVPSLAEFIGFSLERTEWEIDKIFRIQSSQAKDKNLPRDIVVSCVRSRIRDIIIHNSYNNKLIIEDKEAKIFKDIPPAVMLSRQKYRTLVNILKNLGIDFRWERLEGLSFTYRQKRHKIDNIDGAKEMEERLRKDFKENKGDFGPNRFRMRE
ncbi:uncharacterized protein PF11_0207-like [Sceloporus undulatus]|uniref:uncharacterized protein PF11_0207-like n=1 Tax=Sceloporus undulatus TaxID=8520 RepID=UPI001C4BB154|nr:uncharacterized protein PF11_0207-like [Sceloporus undulatus]